MSFRNRFSRAIRRSSTGILIGGITLGGVAAHAAFAATQAPSDQTNPRSPASGPLADRAWHDRLLLVFAPSDHSPVLTEQRRIVDNARSDFAERQLVVIEVVGNQVHGASDSASDLRKRYRVAADAQKVLLVGKDTGVKMTSSTPITVSDLNGTIDRMPMRQSEAKSQ